MSDQDNLRNRIADVIAGEEEHPHPRGYTAHAQAIINEFELTVHGDECGYHEIHGSYDTRFEEWVER